MSNIKYNELLLEIMNTCIEAVSYVGMIFGREDINNINVISMLNDSKLAINKIEQNLKMIDNQDSLLTKAILYSENIIYSIDKTKKSLQDNNRKSAFDILMYEIIPCCKELKEFLYIKFIVLTSKEKIDLYRKSKEYQMVKYREKLNREVSEKKPYKVSITICAYNKLEYTKKAIESIYKYTSFLDGNCELITINNGSTDGTEEYFNSLPNVKKVNLKHNIIGTMIGKHLIEGEFVVGFSNDVLATPNWLEQLLICIESDKKNVIVVPTCNSNAISNLQGIEIPYQNSISEVESAIEFARSYNKSNNMLWEERMVLMPFVSVVRSDYFTECNGLDALYTQAEFIDDDLSTTLRRFGLKQILAKDTFMHHFGSVTLRDANKENNSLENMRKVYFDKWGVDAWESRAIWLGLEECLTKENNFLTKKIDFLLFEPKFGGAFLQFKNYYRQKGCFFDNSMAAVIDQRYIDDAMGLFDEVVTGYKAIDTISSINKVFNIISSGVFLSELGQNNVIEFLEKAYTKLKPGGVMIFPIKNYRNVKVIMQLLLDGGVDSYDKKAYEFSGCSIRKLIENLRQHPYLCNCRIHFIPDGMNPFTREIAEIFEKQRGLLSKENRNELYMELNSSYAIICISKIRYNIFRKNK